MEPHAKPELLSEVVRSIAINEQDQKYMRGHPTGRVLVVTTTASVVVWTGKGATVSDTDADTVVTGIAGTLKVVDTAALCYCTCCLHASSVKTRSRHRAKQKMRPMSVGPPRHMTYHFP